jgi:DNA-binding PadR family transcriptional regulator
VVCYVSPVRTTAQQTRGLTPTEAAIVGLLVDGERSGYDLIKGIGRSVGYFWAPAKSQLYDVLPRLVGAGLASVRTIRQASRPDKQLYRITARGRAALADWINTPAPPEPDRNPLLLQLFFGEFGEPSALLAHVRARRLELEELEATLRQLDSEAPDDDVYPAITRRYGHAYARALIRWAREAEKDLAQRITRSELESAR